MGDTLRPGDIAVGNLAATSVNRYPPKSVSNSANGLVLPYNSLVNVYPDNANSYVGTVKDYGAFDIEHPEYGKYDWVDQWNPAASRAKKSDGGWISFDVPDCKSCPGGSSEYPEAAPGQTVFPGAMSV
jgi:hypothetical protein